MASDRRVLAVAAVAMLAFVTVGVVSASVFAAPVCRSLTATDALDASAPPAAAIADDLVALSELFGDPIQIVVSAPGVRLAGAGSTMFALAWVNDLTGQIDAYASVAHGLEVDDCVETAVVGTPLAFFLDAGDDAMVLLRMEEDASDPEIELVTAAGVTWSAPLDLPQAPPGRSAEAVTAAVDDELVVVARRYRVDDGYPAVVALDRATGSLRWELEQLDDVHAGGDDQGLADVALQIRVVGFHGDDVYLGVVADRAGELSTYGEIVAIDRRTGATRHGTVGAGAVTDTPRRLVEFDSGYLTVVANALHVTGKDGSVTSASIAGDIVGAGLAGDAVVVTLRHADDEMTAWFPHR